MAELTPFLSDLDRYLSWHTRLVKSFMKNVFILWILISLSCLAADTNINYADLPRQIANEDMFGMVLSAETNSLKSGVWINDTNHIIVIRNGEVTGEPSSQATVAMLNMSTNKISFWYFWPSTDLQFQIKLVDDKGNEVPKTAYGKRFGRSPKRNPDNASVTDGRRFGLNNMSIFPLGDYLVGPGSYIDGPSDYNPVRSLPKCFEIEKPGNYKFTLIRHIYVTEQRTNGLFLKPITFSPVTVDVRVESIGK
jgi:hypothetical protein